jgi:hypothetical protein
MRLVVAKSPMFRSDDGRQGRRVPAILIADRRVLPRRALFRALSDDGYQVTLAPDARNLLGALGPVCVSGTEPPYDLIVTRVAERDLLAVQIVIALQAVLWQRPVAFLTMFEGGPGADHELCPCAPSREISFVRSVVHALLFSPKPLEAIQ